MLTFSLELTNREADSVSKLKLVLNLPASKYRKAAHMGIVNVESCPMIQVLLHFMVNYFLCDIHIFMESVPRM